MSNFYFDNQVRISKIIHIESNIDNSCEDFNDFFELLIDTDYSMDYLFEDLGFLKKFKDPEFCKGLKNGLNQEDLFEDLCDALYAYNITGYIVFIEYPLGNRGWNYIGTACFYSKNLKALKTRIKNILKVERSK